MKKLTNRQAEILQLIKDNINVTGMPPTRAEIAKQLGFKSANAAEEHLKEWSKDQTKAIGGKGFLIG